MRSVYSYQHILSTFEKTHFGMSLNDIHVILALQHLTAVKSKK